MHSIRAIPIQTVSSYQFENSVTPSSCSSFSNKDWKLEKLYDPLSKKYRYQVKEIRSEISKKEMSNSSDAFPSFETKIRQLESTRPMNPIIQETTNPSDTETLSDKFSQEINTTTNHSIQPLESTSDDFLKPFEKRIQTLESTIQTLESTSDDFIKPLEKRIQTLESTIQTLESTIQTLKSMSDDFMKPLEERIQTLEIEKVKDENCTTGLTKDRLSIMELEKKIEGIRMETVHRQLNVSFPNFPTTLSEHYIITQGQLVPYIEHPPRELDTSIYQFGHLVSTQHKLLSVNIMVFYTGSTHLSEITFNVWIKPFQENQNIPLGRIQMTKLSANMGRFVSQPMNENLLQRGILFMTVHIPMMETIKTLSLEYSIDIIPISETKRDRIDISFHQPPRTTTIMTPKKSLSEKKTSNPLLFDSRTLDNQQLTAASFQSNHEQEGQINYLLHFLKNGVSK